MSGMTRYYLNRALISAVFGGSLALSGQPWWIALLMGAATFALFLWAPVSGRYIVQRENGTSTLRRDERTQAITDMAGRNAFAVTMIVVGALTLYFGIINPGLVPVHFLSLVLFIGMMTYYVTDLWLRRT
jgi:UPF0716 family protein affecting phage T7 exclusion